MYFDCFRKIIDWLYVLCSTCDLWLEVDRPHVIFKDNYNKKCLLNIFQSVLDKTDGFLFSFLPQLKSNTKLGGQV